MATTPKNWEGYLGQDNYFINKVLGEEIGFEASFDNRELWKAYVSKQGRKRVYISTRWQSPVNARADAKNYMKKHSG